MWSGSNFFVLFSFHWQIALILFFPLWVKQRACRSTHSHRWVLYLSLKLVMQSAAIILCGSLLVDNLFLAFFSKMAMLCGFLLCWKFGLPLEGTLVKYLLATARRSLDYITGQRRRLVPYQFLLYGLLYSNLWIILYFFIYQSDKNLILMFCRSFLFVV